MNRIVFAMLVVITLSGCTTRDSAGTNAPTAMNADDEAAVRALVNEFSNDWNRHDMKAMHELDTQDVEWINVVGHYWRGKDAVYKGHVAIHKGMSAKTSVSVESTTVRSIAPNVAVAVAAMHGGGSLDPRFSSWVLESKSRASFTTVKRDGIWKIAHFQNTVIDPKAENVDETKFDATGFPPPRRSNPLFTTRTSTTFRSLRSGAGFSNAHGRCPNPQNAPSDILQKINSTHRRSVSAKNRWCEKFGPS